MSSMAMCLRGHSCPDTGELFLSAPNGIISQVGKKGLEAFPRNSFSASLRGGDAVLLFGKANTLLKNNENPKSCPDRCKSLSGC